MALTVGTLASCSSACRGPGGEISKVKIYVFDPAQKLKAADPSIRFEKTHFLYGAVTRAEQMERAGQHYSVLWSADDRTQPVTVRFEYRQRDTGFKVHVKEEQVSDVRRSNVTRFQVTGEDYRSNGPVTAWRTTLVRGKEQLAVADSYLWN
jgi:hypothetical protein